MTLTRFDSKLSRLHTEMTDHTKPNNKGRSEGEERTFDCTFWLNKPGGLRRASLMRFVFAGMASGWRGAWLHSRN